MFWRTWRPRHTSFEQSSRAQKCYITLVTDFWCNLPSPGNDLLLLNFIERRYVGDIAEIENESGDKKYITQNKNVHFFNQVSGTVQENSDMFLKPAIKFENILSYNSFHGTGLYPYEYILERQKFLFR